ncbi:MAG: glutamyl-tRNA amidotransferase [Planctomycetes bacterium DG_58]|nr:MAG: glutamyl-tRNA amidotransferase [Planctomycetes bacterium DG_58]KPL01803.1 MAG: glutamyl-tRNA amidotransferase [Planctomycetes bacterium SM23_65]
MIDEKEVQHVARLARLKLSSEELNRFSSQLSKILDYIGQLNEVDTSSVEPMSHPLDLVNVFRADEVKPSLSREDALAGAPQKRDGFFLVPPVLEWGSSEE